MADDHDDRLTGEQIRAARALLRIDQPELERLAGVSLPTIKRLELMEGACAGRASTIAAIRSALEKKGVEFIPQNGGGAGVRLRKRRK
ncbi:MAG: helix-turn-helix domain-containing protein [Rhodospirillaceae bacterium]